MQAYSLGQATKPQHITWALFELAAEPSIQVCMLLCLAAFVPVLLYFEVMQSENSDVTEHPKCFLPVS